MAAGIGRNVSKMYSRRKFTSLAALYICAFAPGIASAETFPSRTVRIIVPYLPGGSADTLARILAEELGKQWKQPVIVENRPGGGTVVGATTAANSKPDGYTLYIASTSHTITPALYKSLPYDPVKSFEPVSMIANSPILLLVNPASGIKSLAELTQLAKTKPGGLNYASPGIGTSPQLAGELYKANAGITVVHVPFNGTSASTAALLGGQVDYIVADISALPLVRGGQLKCLAVTAPARSPLLPDVPTFEEAGVKGVEVLNWSAVVAPAGTDPAIIAAVNHSIAKAISGSTVAEGYGRVGFTPESSTQEQLQSYMVSETAKYKSVIATAGITPE